MKSQDLALEPSTPEHYKFPVPHRYFYTVAAGLFLLELAALGGVWFTRNSDTELVIGWIYIALLTIWLASAFVVFGDVCLDHRKERSELKKRVTAQDDRIRKLEEQIAALTAAQPTHQHAPNRTDQPQDRRN